MRIYEMRATFGKLEQQVLTLKPGLNIIQAPNEWGKSTWCAFLVTMLYGMDTRAKTTKTLLADKEKYAPWSGSPMEGRIDLHWNGRDITIERRTKGRTPFGVFSAYETATGLEVTELNAANCGQQLLGVERSVFVRSGFLRLADLPVTQDEALRRRLNALVTTGDESDSADVLTGKLRDLRNRCRYNRTGLLPQAEAEYSALHSKLRELDDLQARLSFSEERRNETKRQLELLENHQTALQFAASQEDERRVEQAQAAYQQAKQKFDSLDLECKKLPDRETAAKNLTDAQNLQQQWMLAQSGSQRLPEKPIAPQVPEPFSGIPADQAVETARYFGKEFARLTALAAKKSMLGWLILIIGLIAGGGLCLVNPLIGSAVAAVVVLLAVIMLMSDRKKRQALQQQAEGIAKRFYSSDPAQWIHLAESYAAQQEEYDHRQARYQDALRDTDNRFESIRQQMQRLTQGQDLQIYNAQWQKVLANWDARELAVRELLQAENYLSGIRAMVKPAQMPKFPDALTYSQAQTDRMILEASAQLQQLQTQIGKAQGAMTAIGDRNALVSRMEALQRRIGKLQQTYDALELAQKTLEAATAELQRRFAPRIAQRAQELFRSLTGGRYDRLNLTQELTVNAGADGETTMHSAQWRSEGTVDQLYLALRLAVAEELTPDAPMVLDDALVRFDDTRLKRALEILSQQAQSRQVLLFTCQGREAAIMESM